MSTTPAQINALRELVRARLALEQATQDLRVALQPLPCDSRNATIASSRNRRAFSGATISGGTCLTTHSFSSPGVPVSARYSCPMPPRASGLSST